MKEKGAIRVEQFAVTAGAPVIVEWKVGEKSYRATMVLAVHAVLDKGEGRPAAERFDMRVSVATDTAAAVVETP